MIRRLASFAVGLALIVALGLAMAYPRPLKAPGGSTGFSTPCLPASSGLKAVSEVNVVSTVDNAFAAENVEAPAGVTPRSHVETDARAIPPPAARVYAPLFHRPPPANS